MLDAQHNFIILPSFPGVIIVSFDQQPVVKTLRSFPQFDGLAII